jgi:hypothetical protein
MLIELQRGVCEQASFWTADSSASSRLGLAAFSSLGGLA